jgi:hypothetical protein
MAAEWKPQPDPELFEGESLDTIKADYVDISAKYPHRSIADRLQYVFRNMQDGASRYQQFINIFSNDLELEERIRRKINGIPDCDADTAGTSLSEQIKQLELIALTAKEDKDRIAAHRLIAELTGRIVKGGKPEEKPAAAVRPEYKTMKYSDALELLKQTQQLGRPANAA